MITPTIGRMIWFWKNGVGAYLDGAIVQREQPLSAQVVYVWGDRLINIVGFDANGTEFVLASVVLMQDGDPPIAGGTPYCEWMPFQKGQATKTDTLGVALAAKVDALDAALTAFEAKLAAVADHPALSIPALEMPNPNPPGAPPAA